MDLSASHRSALVVSLFTHNISSFCQLVNFSIVCLEHKGDMSSFTVLQDTQKKLLNWSCKSYYCYSHISPIDYGNFLLVGLPAYQQSHLASVLNAAARLVYRLRRYDHITDALATLHWLRFCVCQNVSISRWQLGRIACFTVSLHRT